MLKLKVFSVNNGKLSFSVMFICVWLNVYCKSGAAEPRRNPFAFDVNTANEKDKMERGGLFADGLDLDFAKVYQEEDDLDGSNRKDTLVTPQKKIAGLERKIAEMEMQMMTMYRNIEVLQQNTQVISKGFNILSGRVNDFTKEQEKRVEKLQGSHAVLADKIEAVRKNANMSLTEHSIRNSHEIDALKAKDRELFETQLSNTQISSELKSMREFVDDWSKKSDNETGTMAEMIKTLAEISQSEKNKLKNLTEYCVTEVSRVEETIRQHQVDETSLKEVMMLKLRSLQQTFQDQIIKQSNETDAMKSKMKEFSSYFEGQVKRIDEGILEQNMAHNLAHENIMEQMEAVLKLQNLTDVENMVKKLVTMEANITQLYKANKFLTEHQTGLELTDVAVSEKLADVLAKLKRDNQTTEKEINNTKYEIGRLDRILQSMTSKVGNIEGRVNETLLIQKEKLIETTTSLPVTASKGEVEQIRDRMVTFEENVAQLWRSHKKIADQHETHSALVINLEATHKADNDNTTVRLMELKIATKMLSEIVRNVTRDFAEMERDIENNKKSTTNKWLAHGSDINRMKDQIKTAEENFRELTEKNKNVTSAQDLFLVKLLEIDAIQEIFNRTLETKFGPTSNRTAMGGSSSEGGIHNTEELIVEFSIIQERVNKVVQQFEFIDAEQAKTREELLNIKDRLVSSEESIRDLWKSTKSMLIRHEEMTDTVENVLLIHKSDNKNVTTDLLNAKIEMTNITNGLRHYNRRISNIEQKLNIQTPPPPANDEITISKNVTYDQSDFDLIVTKLRNQQNDISELWKSSEILSFQQQRFNERLKGLQWVHNNDSHLQATEIMKTKFETQNLFQLFGNMSQRMRGVEKVVVDHGYLLLGPGQESRSIDFEIKNWKAAKIKGLKNQQVVFEAGKLIGADSTWRTYVEISGSHLSLYNSLLKASFPVYNEFSVDLLDANGRIFSSYGPDLHLYNVNEKIGWSQLIPMAVLDNPKNGLTTFDSLKMRLKMRIYGKPTPDDNEPMPVEKQLIHWEVRNIIPKIYTQVPDEHTFLDLNVTKEFHAGHYWAGNSRWKSSLLMREINGQKYLGLNMELTDTENDWKELIASYNVTMLDSQGKTVKEFAIASNDFKQVSARHSYFMLIKDLQEILRKSGDMLTFRIYFDLQAKKNLYDVEVIR